LVVNPTVCEAIGVCVHLAPDLVELDRWGYPMMPAEPLDSSDVRVAKRAVRGCPRQALGIASDG
jgi:ferredoxin